MYGGCMFCSTPFGWCQIHHFWHWTDLGPSDLWNMGPLCNHHHHQVHDVGYFIAQTHDGTLALLAPDGTVIATTSIAHPRPPATTIIGGTGYTSVFAASNDDDAAGGRRSPEFTARPKGTEFTIGNPSRGPDPVLLS